VVQLEGLTNRFEGLVATRACLIMELFGPIQKSVYPQH
jgi:hypothetical protein